MLTTSFDNTLHPPNNFELTREVEHASLLVSNATYFHGDLSDPYDVAEFNKGFGAAWDLIAINPSHRLFTLYYTFAQGITCVFNIMALCSLLWINDSFAFHVMDDEIDHFLKNAFTSFMLDLPVMLNWLAFLSMMFSWALGIAIVSEDPETEKVGKLAKTLIGLGCAFFVIMLLLIYKFRQTNIKEARKYYVNIDGSPAFPDAISSSVVNLSTATKNGPDADDLYL